MSPIRYALAFLVSATVTTLLVPWLVKFAKARGLVDHPNARKIHSDPTPRIGGVAILLAVLASVVPGLLFAHLAPAETRLLDPRVITLGCSALAVFLVGFLDDLFGVPAKLKLLTLLAGAIALCAVGVRINSLNFGELVSIKLGALSWPATIIWIVGVTVGINFIDGLDGLAAGIAAVACATSAVVAAHSGQIGLTLMSLALLGSLTAFLWFNANPARIFMGDCGSMFVGFLLASIAVISTTKARTVGIVLPAMALGVPILDTACTFIRRGVLQRRSLFSAERGHVHHRLLDRGFDHRRTVFLLHGVSVLCAAVGLVMLFSHRTSHILVVCALLAVTMLWLLRVVGSFVPSQVIAAVRRNHGIGRSRRVYQNIFEDCQLRFRHVASFEQWWELVCIAGNELGFTRVTLATTSRDGTPKLHAWSREGDAVAPDHRVGFTVPIRQRRVGGPLQAQVEVDSGGCLEDASKRFTYFVRLIQEHSLAELPHTDHAVDAAPEPLAAAASDLGDAADSADSSGAAGRAPHRTHGLGRHVKIAVIHDFLYTYAGAEKVLEQILRVFPTADLFSLFDFLPDDQRGFIQNKPVKSSFIQRLPMARSKHRHYLALMPLAVEQLDVGAYDVVISSSYVAAKGVITRPDQLHVSYCHSPVRFAWDLQHQYLSEAGLANRSPKSLLARAVLHYIRNWDTRSANGVDVFITNSHFVSRRVEKVYRRRSRPIYPPVDVERFALHTDKEDFYFTASRLVPYKKIELIIEAFNRTPDRRLIVVGDGPDFEKLQAKAGPNVKLAGRVSEDRLRNYMQRARAFVFAAEEDFGIVPVEAMACGTPVLAYGRGGVTETVIDGRTGLFFLEQTPESLLDAVARFETMSFDPVAIRKQAERFSADRFRDEFQTLVEVEYAGFTTARTSTLATPPALRRGSHDSNGEDAGNLQLGLSRHHLRALQRAAELDADRESPDEDATEAAIG